MPPITHEDRLRIEPLGPAYHAGFYHLAKDPGLTEILFDHPAPTRDDAWTAIGIAAELRAAGQGYVFVALLGDSVIGAFRLDRQHLRPETAEVGYCVGEQFRGRGLATAAVSLVVDHAFAELGMELLTARCLRDHLASRRVLEKLGFDTTHEAEESTAPVIGYALKRSAWLTSTAGRTPSSARR